MTVLTEVFRQLLSMSLMALPVMAVAVLGRWALGRLGAPRKLAFLLWAVVGFRLVCPITLSSALSVFNCISPVANATMSGGSALSQVQLIPAPSAPPLEQIAPLTGIGAEAAAQSARSLSVGDIALRAAAMIWLVGIAAILISGLMGDLRLRRRLATAVRLRDNLYETDGITTPFVLGLLRPRIYIPFRLEPEEQTYILLHEQTHLRRGDPWWKLLAFLLLSVYWWNPSVWLCWALFTRDMELSCDEAVLRKLGPDVKQAYSRSLVSFAAGRRFPAPSPLAFGEADAKSRVKNVLNWKRLRPGLVFLAAALCLLVVIICGTNARGGSWIRANGRDFTWNYGKNVTSVVVYEEVYQGGTLSARTILSTQKVGDAAENTPRSGAATLDYQPNLTSDGSQSGYSWIWTEAGTAVQLPSAVTGSYIGYASDWMTQTAGKELLAPGDSRILGAMTMDSGTGASSFPLDGTVAERQAALDAAPCVVLLLVQLNGDTAEGLNAAQSTTMQAKTLYALHNPYAGNAEADGKLTETLLDAAGLPGAKLELFTSRTPYALQLDFSQTVDDQDGLDTAMQKNACALLALIDNLEAVRWQYAALTNGKLVTVTKTLSLIQANSQAYAALNPPENGISDLTLPADFSIKDYGKSEESFEALWTALNTGAGQTDVSALTAQTPEEGAPYPSKFGSLGQYAYTLSPTVQSCGILVVTYADGKEVDRNWGAIGNVGDGIWNAKGTFQLSWNLGETETGWNTLDWNLYPDNDAAEQQSFDVRIAQTTFAGPDGIWAGDDMAGRTISVQNGAAVPLAAVARKGGGGGTLPESVESLSDPAALSSFTQSNELAAVAYFVSSPERDGVYFSEPFTDVLGYDGTRVTETTLYGWSYRAYYADLDGEQTQIAESFGAAESADYIVDLDGDGTQELVCNVTSGADGHQEAYVYRRQGDSIEQGTLSTDGLPNFNDWGVNAHAVTYDPLRNVFTISYAVKGQEDYAAVETRGLERVTFAPYRLT